jgi:hypothetical protein
MVFELEFSTARNIGSIVRRLVIFRLDNAGFSDYNVLTFQFFCAMRFTQFSVHPPNSQSDANSRYREQSEESGKKEDG